MRRALLAVFLLLPALTWAENFFELIERSAYFELISEAARELTPQKVKAALDAAADLEARDVDGWTPLMYAARDNENAEVVQALLDAGADADATARNAKGDSVWDLIQKNELLKGANVHQRLNQLRFE